MCSWGHVFDRDRCGCSLLCVRVGVLWHPSDPSSPPGRGSAQVPSTTSSGSGAGGHFVEDQIDEGRRHERGDEAGDDAFGHLPRRFLGPCFCQRMQTDTVAYNESS
eukprot:2821592-Prymnesium_polylepis.2